MIMTTMPSLAEDVLVVAVVLGISSAFAFLVLYLMGRR